MVGSKLVILDRDGVLNEDTDHPCKLEDLKLIPNAAKAVKLLNDKGYVVCIATNQSVVGRGMCTREDVEKFNTELKNQIYKESGGKIRRIMICPHAPNPDGTPTCKCRKPSTYMYRKLKNYVGAKPEDCYVIGDRLTDLLPADQLGMNTIQVMTGAPELYTQYTVCKDLLSAVNLILIQRGEFNNE